MADHDPLTRRGCLTLLRTASVGRIAYSEQALPAIATVRFAVLGELIVVPLDVRSPLVACLRGTVVAFEAGLDGDQGGEWSVTCVGRATTITGASDLTRVAASSGWLLPAEFLAIGPELLRGRRFHLATLSPAVVPAS